MGTLKEDLAANVLALLKAERPFGEREKRGVQRLVNKGLSLGNAQRVLDGETSIGLDVLAQVAEKLGVQPWQLLVPGLDPSDKPAAVPASHASGWPFDFERARFAALTEKERGMVEHAAWAELERIERSRPRPSPRPTAVQPDTSESATFRNAVIAPTPVAQPSKKFPLRSPAPPSPEPDTAPPTKGKRSAGQPNPSSKRGRGS